MAFSVRCRERLAPGFKRLFASAAVVACGVPCGLAQPAPDGTGAKIATIRLQAAILDSGEGRRAAVRMKNEWAPEVASIAQKDAELEAERERFNRESQLWHGWWPVRHTMSRGRKTRMQLAIQLKAAALQRERDRDRDNVEQERRRVVSGIEGRMEALLDRYARENGYTVILDADSPGSFVLVSLDDITGAIVGLYDRTYPAAP